MIYNSLTCNNLRIIQAEEESPETVQGASVYGLHAWARLEEQLGNWKEARDLLSRAALIQPGNAVIHQSRALLEAKAHNWGPARHHFRLAVKANPKDVKCWHVRSLCRVVVCLPYNF